MGVLAGVGSGSKRGRILTLAENILRYLQMSHTGHNRAVKASTLAAHFGENERVVRDAIHELRAQHYPVCSDVAGFWWPTSREDAGPGIHWIVARFKPLREAYDGFMAGLDREFGEPSLFDQVEEEALV